MGVKDGLHDAASAYRKLSRYFFYALLVFGLLGTVTGAFAQSQNTALPLTLTLSDVQVFSGPTYSATITSATGTVTVSGPWSGGPLHFSGWIAITDDQGVINGTITSGDFSPSSLSYPSPASSSFEFTGPGRDKMISYVLVIDAYNQTGHLVGTTGEIQGTGHANLFILNIELPLFQVPALGISASSPDFSNLFATFDQMPLGDYYMLLAEVAVIFLIGAGLVNFIFYLTGGGEGRNQTKTLAGLNNLLITVLVIFLLPYAYNAVAGFVDVLDQVIIAGPGHFGTYSTTYLTNLQLVRNTLPTGGNILTDVIGLVASVMAWVFTWLLGSARLFLIGSVIVAMPVVLVLRDIKFTSRFAGTIEDTLYGLVFASMMSALFIGLAAYLFNNWDGSIFAAANVAKTWVALAALLGAIFIPTVFAPLSGIFFQTMAQTGMAAAGTAISMGAGAAGPAGAGIAGGAGAASQAISGLGSGAGFAQKAGAALSGFGGAFAYAIPHMGQNMLLMGTVGTLGGLGASRAASSINRMIELKTPGQTTQSINSHRAGMLTGELGLPEAETKAHIARALGAGVHHDEIRAIQRMSSNLDGFRQDLDTKIKLKTGKP
ncbi:MAG: hypothetical protein JRN45_00320 [Nitrososphaerota archaeon]|nr:hypothetical protein [Nitrososphaerota archaeon]